jgi:hypothetical protein
MVCGRQVVGAICFPALAPAVGVAFRNQHVTVIVGPTHRRMDVSANCGVRCNRSDSGNGVTAAPIPGRPPQNPLTLEGVVQMGSGADVPSICFRDTP